MKKFGFLLTFSAVLISFRCEMENPSKLGTQLSEPSITGILYNIDGSFSKNTVVSIRKKSSMAEISGITLDMKSVNCLHATTDNSGRFSVSADLEPDIYVIEAINGNRAALIDSVKVLQKAVSICVTADTLKQVGAIKGVIRLSHGGDVQNVYVLSFGLDRFTSVNADGSFLFTNLAEGVYTLRILSGLTEYSMLDTGFITVTAAETTDIKLVELPYRAMPTPIVSVSYDTSCQKTILHWSRIDTSIVKGYNIYRKNTDSNGVFSNPLNLIPVFDTIFIDSTGIQNMTYEYRVAAVNHHDIEGEKNNGTSVEIATFFTVDTVYKLEPGEIEISPSGDIFMINGIGISVFDSTMRLKKNITISSLNFSGIFSVNDDHIFALFFDHNSSFSEAVSVVRLNADGRVVDTILKRNIDHNFNGTVNLSVYHKLFTVCYRDSVLIFSSDGSEKNRWQFDGNCSKLYMADSNKIIIYAEGQTDKLIMFDTLGNIISEISIPLDIDVGDLAYELKKDMLYVVGGYSNQFNRNYQGKLYAFDWNGTKIASYWIYDKFNLAGVSIGFTKNGSLLIAHGNTEVIKLNPLAR